MAAGASLEWQRVAHAAAAGPLPYSLDRLHTRQGERKLIQMAELHTRGRTLVLDQVPEQSRQSLPVPVMHGTRLSIAFFYAPSQPVPAKGTRLAPPDRVAEATAGVTLAAFLAYVAGPAVFAAAVRLLDSWTLPMLGIAAQAAVAAVLLAPPLLREARANPCR